MLKIAVIMSTTRQTRFADKVAAWFMPHAQKRKDMQFDLVDLRDFPMPLFDEVASNAWMPSKNEVAQKWQKKIAQYDGYIFIVAEYNHTIPAALKNAIDYAYPEWVKKPAAFVGYGGVGAARAIEHLRNICVELQMVPLRSAVHIQGGDFMAVWQQGRKIEELAYLQQSVDDVLEQTAWWSGALKAPREALPKK